MHFKYGKEVLVLLIIIAAATALYYSFQPEACTTLGCYQENMRSCKATTYINEEQEASWKYTILGKKQDNCLIDVTLLNAKEGDLQLRQHEGSSMTCSYPFGTLVYPQQNLEECTGPLKENLQGVIIDKLYRYIINNLGEVQEGLRQL